MDYLRKDITGRQKQITLVPYDSNWPQLFERESFHIKKALRRNCIAIHHFGSTAVPGLQAKPVIDILAEVKEISLIDINAIEQLDFEYRGEVIISGRYFSKKNPGVHLHIFEVNSPITKLNLDFRDWLRAHPDDREAYALLKEQLSILHHDGVSYSRAKTEFVNNIQEKIRKNT
jgi:GrpB-like predicted nucleotidyltransferase (UPF0157 family)